MDLVDPDLWDQIPPDLDDLLRLLPRADVSLQDEVQLAFHLTLTRLWSHKGRRGQRLVEAPGANDKVYRFGIVDWVDAGLMGASHPVARPMCFVPRFTRWAAFR
jgi:hypothetical protein